MTRSMSQMGTTEPFYLQATRGQIGGHTVIQKFGRNDSIGTTFSPVTIGGVYQTPQSATQLRISDLDKNGTEPGGTVHLLAAVLRIGNGDVIDNFASGGMFTMLDESGVALYPGVDKQSNVYREHPVTGTPIVGFQVPMYDRVLELTHRLARRTPEAPYVGWDLAITPNGPVVIEGNHNSSVFQPKPSASGVRTGLLPVYRAAVGF